jgi:hypothetical protein
LNETDRATNVILGSFITAQGRIKVHKAAMNLLTIPEITLYMVKNDAIYFTSSKTFNPKTVLPVGYFYGQFRPILPC